MFLMDFVPIPVVVAPHPQRPRPGAVAGSKRWFHRAAGVRPSRGRARGASGRGSGRPPRPRRLG